MLPLLAVGDRVLVQPDPPKTRLGKIHVPDQPSTTGKIVDLGPAVEGLKRGQRIAYARRVGVEVDVNRMTYLLLPYSACLAVLP